MRIQPLDGSNGWTLVVPEEFRSYWEAGFAAFGKKLTPMWRIHGWLAFLPLFFSAVVTAQAAPQSGVITPGPSPRAQADLEAPWALEYPFINLIKDTGNWWAHGKNDVVLDPTVADSNGYPLYDPNAASYYGWTIGTRIPQQYARAGHYVLTWTGAGDFEAIREFPDQSGGVIHKVSCTGSGSCNNTNCNAGQEMRGYVAGNVLTVTTAPSESGCSLVVGQPISGAGIAISKFGTPTIITGKSGSSNCPSCTGTGATGTYLINFSQTAGSSGRTIPIKPGGRFEFSITDEIVGSNWNTTTSSLSINLRSTGTITNQSNTAQNIALVYSCLNTGHCDGEDDEEVYWTGQIIGTKLKQVLTGAGIGVIRDLGFTQNVFSGLTTWGSRKPATYYAWGTTEMRNSIYTGSRGGNPVQTANTTTSFTGSISGSILTASNVTGKIANGQYLDAAHVKGTISNGSKGAGTILNVNSVVDGTLAVGQFLYDAGGVISDNFSTGAYTRITTNSRNTTPTSCGGSPCTGAGGIGTYLVSISQYVTPNNLWGAKIGTDIINVTNIGVAPKTTISASALPSQQVCGSCTGTGGAELTLCNAWSLVYSRASAARR